MTDQSTNTRSADSNNRAGSQDTQSFSGGTAPIRPTSEAGQDSKSASKKEREFATNVSDTSDADDPTDAQVFTRSGEYSKSQE